MPSPADAPALAAYGADPVLLEGIWVSGSPPLGDPYAWACARIDEFLAGWCPPGGPHGATLAIRERGRLVGFVYMSRREGCELELAYGIAPPERGKGLATRAALLATSWALEEGDFDRVLLYVDEDHSAGHRVAAKAGFRQIERVVNRIEQTGETFVQVVYVRTRKGDDPDST
ncbi:MAG TPA: GNAT family N-acetyltransferase [Longimicrobiaceae bacterium]